MGAILHQTLETDPPITGISFEVIGLSGGKGWLIVEENHIVWRSRKDNVSGERRMPLDRLIELVKNPPPPPEVL